MWKERPDQVQECNDQVNTVNRSVANRPKETEYNEAIFTHTKFLLDFTTSSPCFIRDDT